ncbi:AI-2E family transporter [Agrobacterium tumefaciens]|uniref:AI-2E family transporter n=1 Tax=Agrobacterium tumefaciens TaxID=358 RepID=UPI00287EFFE3|nr:AI-2E family transporter [Agrobacterium tumefaciens]MDS7594312.1 AI-2E family transporter [Agrobacterium tumefaciens]
MATVVQDKGKPAFEITGSDARISDFIRLGIIVAFAYWAFQLVAPFALIMVWATIMTVALYPLQNGLARLLGGRKWLAAIIIVSIFLFVIITPLAIAAVNFVDTLQGVFADAGILAVPKAPEQLIGVPVIGASLYAAWNEAASNLTAALISFKEPLREAGTFILTKALSIGGGILSFVASALLCGVLLTVAPRLSLTVQTVASRIAGDRGVGYARLAGITVRNVSRGVIGVALLQAILCGFIFVAFDVPARGALIYGIFILCLIQIGPGLILLPLLIWTWFSWPFNFAALFSVLIVPVMLVDNILKPVLISRGLTTPMPVILIGVIGGTLTYGLVGPFYRPCYSWRFL